MSDARRAALFANLEKARQKRKEQAEMSKKTKDTEKVVMKQRQEVRLMELEKEKGKLAEAIESKNIVNEVSVTTSKKKKSIPPNKFTRVRTPDKPLVFDAVHDTSESCSCSGSGSCECTSSDDDVQDDKIMTKTMATYNNNNTKVKSSKVKYKVKNSKRDDYIVDDARERLAERIRTQAATAAFASLFPTWQILER